MKPELIVLSVGVIALLCLGFYMSVISKEQVETSAVSHSPLIQIKGMHPASVPFVLIEDRSIEKYGPYYDLRGSGFRQHLGSYFGLYALPSYDFLREYLEKGGYIGSPLDRSRRELYNDCLIYSRYTYECQNGAQY